MKIDAEVAITKFVERYREHHDKALEVPPGPLSRRLCRRCGIQTEFRATQSRTKPRTLCMACDILEAHGLMEEALKRAQEMVP